MSNKKKIINKGYTLEVVSWENDGDNYKTKSHTFDNKEEALGVKHLCETIFKSCNNGDGGIGNTNEGDEDTAKDVIITYLRTYSESYSHLDHMANPIDEELIDFCMDLNYTLMGGSEWYYSRVFESCSLVYSDKDVFLEEID